MVAAIFRFAANTLAARTCDYVYSKMPTFLAEPTGGIHELLFLFIVFYVVLWWHRASVDTAIAAHFDRLFNVEAPGDIPPAVLKARRAAWWPAVRHRRPE